MICAVKIVKESFQFLRVPPLNPLTKGREKIKDPHSGPKYGVMNGGFPLIYDSFTGQNFLWGSKGSSAPLFKKKKRHTWKATHRAKFFGAAL
jgi:hypothetical protein